MARTTLNLLRIKRALQCLVLVTMQQFRNSHFFLPLFLTSMEFSYFHLAQHNTKKKEQKKCQGQEEKMFYNEHCIHVHKINAKLVLSVQTK